ncbi:hypothetical protein J3458_020171 [Metarhizium acridum]|uniref:uncharacterized protein n=1 Tax=Metarhizium acridum TaxID=92637 RepID=UPI001C6C955F|nr:hypothetical protein J3458_020171 [Metarhizium acridum]
MAQKWLSPSQNMGKVGGTIPDRAQLVRREVSSYAVRQQETVLLVLMSWTMWLSWSLAALCTSHGARAMVRKRMAGKVAEDNCATEPAADTRAVSDDGLATIRC